MADIIGDITKLNFKNNTFDLIICNHVLEHIIDDRTAMNEIYRVLKKDGIGILQVPIDKNLEKKVSDAEREILKSKDDQMKNINNEINVYPSVQKENLISIIIGGKNRHYNFSKKKKNIYKNK